MSHSFKVLIAENNQGIVDGLKRNLNWNCFHGVICGSVSNGIEGLATLQRIRPDAIIVEADLPLLNGLDFAKQVYESTFWDKIPVILLSDYEDFSFVQRALASHVDFYITKPLTCDKLEQLEDALSSLYKAREASQQELSKLLRDNPAKNISVALENCDYEKIETYFCSLTNIDISSNRFFNIWGFQLIDCLYDHMEKTNFIPKAFPASRHLMTEAFLELPSSASKYQYLTSTFLNYLEIIQSKKSYAVRNIFIQAQQLIDKNYTNVDFNIGNLARELNVSNSYISIIFKQLLGISPSKYLTQKRIDYSKVLLKSTDLPIQDVSLKCGYGDSKYFSTLFRKFTGQTPSEFRSQSV